MQHNGGGTTTATVTSNSPVLFGEESRFTATIIPSGLGTPTGEVEFAIGPPASPIVTGTAALSGNMATFTTTALPAGSYSYQATYTGDGNFSASNTASGASNHVVNLPDLVITADGPLDGQFGVSYSAQFSASRGGTPATSYSIVSTAPGLSGTTPGTLSGTPTQAGSFEVTVGASDASGDASQVFPVIIAQGTSSVTLSSDQNSSTAGQQVTFTAAVAGPSGVPGPTGNVNFSIDSGPVQAVALNAGGQASFSTDQLPPGSHQIDAVYAGDGNYLSASDSLQQVVNQIATSVTLTSQPNPSTVDDPVLFTVTVNPSDASGNIIVSVDGNDQAPVAVLNGVAAVNLATLTTGGHDVVARFVSTDPDYADATSATLTQTVNKFAPTLALGASSLGSHFGDDVTFTATLAGVTTATGTITFSIDGVDQPPVNVSNTTATLMTSALAVGNHTITASYSGDIRNDAADAQSLAFTVGQQSTTLTVSSSNPGSKVGEIVTFTATVAGGAMPTGRVTFSIDGVDQPPANLTGAVATLSTADLPAGDHSIGATYPGDTNNAPSTASVITQAVSKIATSMTLTQSSANSDAGDEVTFTASVTPADATGTVTFIIDGREQAPSTIAAGSASLVTSTLAPGDHTIIARYDGNPIHASSTSASVTQTVNKITTSTVLTQSSTNSLAGDPVTFTAQVTPADATGEVTFIIDGGEQAPSAIAAGSASFATSVLVPGDHTVIARYDGDAVHDQSTSSALTHSVAALGTIILRQETDGGDAVFGFSSPQPALNFSLATAGGSGQSAAISLPAGSYRVTADDMTGAGYGLTAIACSNRDSTTDISTRSATIALGAGEAVICTFTAVNSAERTAGLIADFLSNRADLILANQPDSERRIARLNGTAGGGGSPSSALMGYLPGLVEGRASVTTSLAAIDAMAGNRKPSRFDAWFSGTFARLDTGDGDGDFGTFAIGADYLLNSDLLVGAFVQFDHMSEDLDDKASASGTGWLAGPYVTARIMDNLYLDLLAAGGTSANTISPYGTYDDDFDATRFLVSAAIEGNWQWDNWTFSPRARLSYFEETSKSYTDSLGVTIDPVTVGKGQIAIGPAISYRFVTDGEITVDTGFRLEGIADIVNNGDWGVEDAHGRIEANLAFGFASGARIGLSAAYDGIGDDSHATSGRISVSLPMN